jgi:hypothetical protein
MWGIIIILLDLLLMWRFYIAVISGIVLFTIISFFWMDALKYVFLPIMLSSLFGGFYWNRTAKRIKEIKRRQRI